MDSTQTKPDALEMLRTFGKDLKGNAWESLPLASLEVPEIIAALEAERRENDASIAALNDAYGTVRAQLADRNQRDAKIRSFLEEARQAYNLLGAVKAYRARTNIAEALALLDGGAE